MIIRDTEFNTAPYTINRQYDDTAFQTFIDDVESEILLQLLGATLKNELYDDLVDYEPITQKWIDFVYGVDFTNQNDKLVHYQGIRVFLLPMIYSRYHEANADRIDQLGLVTNTPENGSVSRTGTIQMVYKYWNKGVDFYDNARQFLYNQSAVYIDAEREPINTKELISYP